MLTFHGVLNDFLPQSKQNQAYTLYLQQLSSVKDAIESIGIPHTEIDVILVNNCSVDFSYLVESGDEICVFPPAFQLLNDPIIHLTPQPLDIARFVLDTHLGKLATYLRMLGFDTLYRNDYTDERLAEISSCDDRILLTRDRGLLKRKAVIRGYFLRNTTPHLQLIEIIERFRLSNQFTPFTRCLQCNGVLNPVKKSAIEKQLSEKTRGYFNEFRLCSDCGQIYWKGSHFDHMQSFIEEILRQCA